MIFWPREHEPLVDVGERGLLGRELQTERLDMP
jgi:hypothetical protein